MPNPNEDKPVLINIRFEVTGKSGIDADALHELLCQAIHEGSEDAYQTLNDNVADIIIPS